VLNDSNVSSVNTDIVKTNINHTQFLKELCLIVRVLYLTYKMSIEIYNFDNDTKLQDNIIIKNSKMLNICRIIIKNFGCEEDKKNIDDVFKTEAPIQRKCRLSPLRKSRKIQQSRATKEYRISKEVMEKIIAETPLSKHSPCKGPFVKPPKYPKYKNFKSYLF